MRVRLSIFLSTLVVGLGLSCLAQAHDTPVQLPPPQSEPEAWNVVEQSKANIDGLLSANLMRDVGAQLLNISVALRSLLTFSANDANAAQAHPLLVKLISSESDVLRDSRDPTNAQALTKADWGQWCDTLKQLEALYPADTVKAEVYICPMHSFDRHLKPDDKCSVCGMSLIRRHLPASGVYQQPGTATLKLTTTCPPLVVGQQANVIIHLSKPDGSPVKLDDLIEVHTKKIHLLINDHSLSDYHHIHPDPADKPGDYQFSFTPTKPGPYRIWADVVPTSTSTQEYVIADLPADTAPLPISDRDTRLSTIVDGRKYSLAFDPAAGPIHARQTIVGTITVTASDGTGFTQLEPVMGAFAHIVGFSEDGKSVLHIHPFSKEPTAPTERAGPAFAFKFYAPSAGFLRLYCQVHIDGKDVFAPFNLTVLSAADAATTQP